MELSSADRALAASIAAAHPLELQRYRIEAEWPGGGFSCVRECDSPEAALTYGQHRARHHKGAVVTVTLRDDLSPQVLA